MPAGGALPKTPRKSTCYHFGARILMRRPPRRIVHGSTLTSAPGFSHGSGPDTSQAVTSASTSTFPSLRATEIR